ncbi:MAG: glycosyltransferase family 4 protein [Bacteroidota bacterium]
MHILIVAPYPPKSAPSQRFRLEHYLPYLEEHGITYDYVPFYSEKVWNIMYRKGKVLAKVLGVMQGFLKRILLLFRLRKYDKVFVHREATPLGPPFFEWWATHVFRKELIFDFDDAIWLPNASQVNRFSLYLKWNKKVNRIIKWAEVNIAGNKYLEEHSQKFSSNSILIPTVVDTENHHKGIAIQDIDSPNIGWTGSITTLEYLSPLVPVIAELEKKYEFTFYVIANVNPNYSLNSVKFIPWNKETEIVDLLRFQIGVMPLVDNPWTRGKCGFKAIQYMALGQPALASPVSANKEIIDHGVNGFFCSSDEDWYQSLEKLLLDKSLRERMGKEARKKIQEKFSVKATLPPFVHTLQEGV